MTELKNVVEHLQIIRTWAELDGKMGRGMEPKCCLRIAEWVDEALDVLKEQEKQSDHKHETNYGDWSGAQGNDIDQITEQARRSEWGIFG